MESGYPQFFCPLCGTTKSVRYFDPSGFSVDVIGVRFRGLGRGKGFSIVSEGSLLDSEDPVVGRIADRVAVLYDMLFETEEVQGLLQDINDALGTEHETLLDASADLLSRFEDYVEEDWDDDDAPEEDEVPAQLSYLDREMQLGENEEE